MVSPLGGPTNSGMHDTLFVGQGNQRWQTSLNCWGNPKRGDPQYFVSIVQLLEAEADFFVDINILSLDVA